MFKEGKFPKTNMSVQINSVIFPSFFSLRSKLAIECRFTFFSINRTFVTDVQWSPFSLVLFLIFSFPPSISLLYSLISKPSWTCYDNDTSSNIYGRALKSQGTLCQWLQYFLIWLVVGNRNFTQFSSQL